MRIGAPTNALGSSIAGSSTSVSYRPALDANHVAAWYFDSYDGQQFPSAIAGSGSMWTGANSGSFDAVENPIFRSGIKAATYVGTAPSCISMSASIPSQGGSQNLTLEQIVYLPTTGYTSLYQWTHVGLLQGTNSFFGHRIRQNNVYQYVYTSRFWYSSANHDWDQPYTYGVVENNIRPHEPHHLMSTWNPSTNTAQWYLDGWQMATSTNSFYWNTRGDAITVASVDLGRDIYVADMRVSNIIRPQSYAIAATRAMRSM